MARNMRRRFILLATASTVCCSPSVFSVYDDLLAFPQFEVVFSDTYISDSDAESKLTFPSSSAFSKSSPTASSTSYDAIETTAELATRDNNGSPFSTDTSDRSSPETTLSFEYMMLGSSPHLCSIPQVTMARTNKSSAASSKAEEERDLARAADRGWELLKDLEGHCMYFVSGWWSYSFCYNSEVKQFHQLPPGRGGVPVYPPIEDQQVPSYVLGKLQERTSRRSKLERQRISGPTEVKSIGLDVAQLQTKGDTRYMVQKLSGGTTCDLTGKERKIEIQFHCHPQSTDRIGWIKEISTCSYLMMIYTPRLCNDIAFLPPRETKAHQIVCQKIIPEDEIDEMRAKKAVEADRMQVNAGKSDEQSRPIVGGIELGGMKIVGQHGRRIEPPKPLNPTEGKADIVAKSDPSDRGGKVQRLSSEDLKKMDLDPEVVEDLRRKLQDLAGEKGWTLEVVDGPGGLRELRGIVDGDEEEEGGEGTSGEEENEENNEEDNEGGSDEGSEEIFKDEL